MLKKMKACISKKQAISALVMSTVISVMSVNCFAEGTDISASMATSLGGVKSDVLAAIAVIAPVGIAIMSVFLCWKKGIGFFKSVAK